MTGYCPPDAFYSQSATLSSLSRRAINRIIGNSGVTLKRITTATDTAYLWYDFKRQVIEIWGNKYEIELAKEKIDHVIHKLEVEREKYEIDYIIHKEFFIDSPHYARSSTLSTLSPMAIKKIIGKHGANLKNINIATRTKHLWYDVKRQVIEIWGSEYLVERAKYKIDHIIQKEFLKDLVEILQDD